MALWPHLHQVHLGSGAAEPAKLPGKFRARNEIIYWTGSGVRDRQTALNKNYRTGAKYRTRL